MADVYLVGTGVSHGFREFVRALDGDRSALRPSPVPGTVDPLEPLPLGSLEPNIRRLIHEKGTIPIEWRLAGYIGPNAIDMLVVRILNSRTIGEVLDVWKNYASLVTNATIIASNQLRNGNVVMTISCRNSADPLAAFMYRWIVAISAYSFLSYYQFGVHLGKIDAHAPDIGTIFARMNQQFDFCEVVYTETETRFIVPGFVCLSPMTCKEQDVKRALEHELRNRLVLVEGNSALESRIRAHIIKTRAFDISQAEVCAIFGLEPRKLRRQLQMEGTTLTEIQRSIRRERAFNLVSSTDLPLKQIASELAFHSDASFSMAFKAWTGLSPGAFRKGAQANRSAA